MGWFKKMVSQWLEIEGARSAQVHIIEPMTLESEIFRNKIWYRGNAGELNQFYAQTDDMVGNTGFWAQQSSSGVNFRKMHSGLPALMVDTLSDIVCNDLAEIRVNADGANDYAQEEWDELARENGFAALLKTAVRTALAEGDGAFKISFDEAVSDYPIIEFFGADRVRFDYRRGRIERIIFLTEYRKDRRKFLLEEIYAKNLISYRLSDENGHEIALDTLEETAGLTEITFNGGFLMAVPLLFDRHPRYEGRGKSIYDGKTGALDSLDETISQWLDALRDGRVTKYIPANLLPRNAQTGAVLKPNSFDNRYIQTEADMRENASSEIKVAQPEIKTEALLASYLNFLDLCLQGVISPSTLGIDVKKRDNAEAQREKEKVTLYTRNRVIGVLRQTLPLVVDAVMKTADALQEKMLIIDYNVQVEFGEYANPSFEAQVETIGKARQYGIMSCETVVEQLYGDTWSREEKAAEIARLKAEQAKGSRG
jgi:hypothetical protein